MFWDFCQPNPLPQRGPRGGFCHFHQKTQGKFLLCSSFSSQCHSVNAVSLRPRRAITSEGGHKRCLHDEVGPPNNGSPSATSNRRLSMRSLGTRPCHGVRTRAPASLQTRGANGNPNRLRGGATSAVEGANLQVEKATKGTEAEGQLAIASASALWATKSPSGGWPTLSAIQTMACQALQSLGAVPLPNQPMRATQNRHLAVLAHTCVRTAGQRRRFHKETCQDVPAD